MKTQTPPSLPGELLDEAMELTLAEFCRLCRLPAEEVLELVDEGIVEPVGRNRTTWRFRAASVRRVRCAVQLRRDLGVNWPGAALALDLLDELQAVRVRLRRLEG